MQQPVEPDRAPAPNPYEPPVASLGVTRLLASGVPVPMGPSARVLSIVLQVYAVFAAFCAVATLWVYRGGTSPFRSDAFSPELAVVGATWIASALAFFVTAFLFARFVYRANQNARVLGNQEPRYGPAGMVVWFFVPIANLIWPYEAFKDVYRCSFPAHEEPELHPMLSTWWVLWMGRCVTDVLVEQSSVGQIAALTGLWGLLAVGSALCATTVVRALAERQDLTARLQQNL